MRSLTVGQLKKILNETEGLTDDTLVVIKSMEVTDWSLSIEKVHVGLFENGGVYSADNPKNNMLILDADDF